MIFRPLLIGLALVAAPFALASGKTAPQALASSLQSRMVEQFKNLRALTDGVQGVQCEDRARTIPLLRPLRLRGRYAACTIVAERCIDSFGSEVANRSSLPEADQALLREALRESALCQAEMGRYKEARRSFEAAAALFAGQGRMATLLAHASTMLEMSEEPTAVGVAQLILNASGPRKLAGSSHELLELLRPAGWVVRSSRDQDLILARFAEHGRDDPRFVAALWLARISSMLESEGRPLQALEALSAQLELIDDPYAAFRIAYQALFALGEIATARALYEAYLPYAHVESWLPIESNSYDYSQLASTVCRDKLLQGEPARRLQNIASSWALGRKDRATTLSQAMQLARELPGFADVETLLGSLFEAMGRDASAQLAYWRAHQACPYYDRAHWGLYSLRRTRKTGGLALATELLQRSEKLVERAGVPRVVATYVINWESLPSREQKQLLGAIRPWLPHLGALTDAGYRLYVKRAFERVSDVPGFAAYRDARVGDASRTGDRRLWDDLRGLGAPELKTVVVDIGDARAALLGGYNLAGHEVAHQVHRMLSRQGAECVSRLYQAARAKAAWVTPAAAVDEHEYFAESAAAWLQEIPSWRTIDPRGRGWLEAFDPRMAALIEGIALNRDGKLGSVRCPE